MTHTRITRTQKPVIGITMNWQQGGDYSPFPHVVLRDHYFNSVYKAGGLPVAIPYLPEAVDEYVALVDGLIIPGGDFALDRNWYIGGDDASPYAPSPRLAFDVILIKKALERDIPVLGICAGMQIMAGMFGCKLTPDVMRYTGTSIDHRDEKPRNEVAHQVKIFADTRLGEVTGAREFGVNTSHREGVVKLSEAVVINAIAPDGVIEGVEIPGYTFAIGVQWHPEFFQDENNPNFKIFQALVGCSQHT